ncbi:MAG: hypothetical protein RLZZ06_328 [Actinomycetota bacterium]|jgi:uncharacterized protein (DUF58 family)
MANETRTKRTAASSTADASRTQATFASGTESGTVRVSYLMEKLRGYFGFASKLLGIAKTWVLETVTKLGWISLLLAVLWLPLGVWLAWPEFFFLGAVATVIILVAIPFLIGGKNYIIGFSLPEDHLVAGESTNAPISVTNTNKRLELPGVLEVQIGDGIEEFPIPLLRAGETKLLPFELASQPRGILKVGPITTVRTDPVGALRKETKLLDAMDVHVYPQTRVLPPTVIGYMRDLEGNPTLTVVEADMTFHSIREYVAGDNPKHIHWKATAKIGKPGKFLVRQYAESRRSRMVIILAMNPAEYLAGSDEFEVAISAVGSLGARAILDSRSVSVVISEEIPKLAKNRMRAIRELRVQTRKRLMEDLCVVNPSEQTMSLKDVCRLAAGKYQDMSLAVVVTGSGLTARQLQEARSVLPNNIGVAFVTADGREDAKPKFFKANTIDVLNIQEIQDLPGLLGRYRG